MSRAGMTDTSRANFSPLVAKWREVLEQYGGLQRVPPRVPRRILVLPEVEPTSAWWSHRESSFYYWLKLGAWCMCPTCKVIHPRIISQSELLHGVKVSQVATRCWQCVHSPKLALHLVGDVPSVLRRMQPSVLWALRPCVLSQGDPVKPRNDYVRKDKLSMLRWSESSVRERVDGLDEALRFQGRAAYEWLLDNNPAYAAYVHAHRVKLRNRTFSVLPSHLTEPYLETALWPHLYPYQLWCETHEIAPSARQPFAGNTVSASKYSSLKAAFLRKVCSPIADYGADYSLLQFNFDRYLLELVRNRTEIAAGAIV